MLFFIGMCACVNLGGDIVSGDGRGSISIFGKYFEDENLTIDHTGPGLIGMANSGPNKNGCQFYITTMQSPWLNGKHTIFGKVIKGASYVHVIEKVCSMRTFILCEKKKLVRICYFMIHEINFMAFNLIDSNGWWSKASKRCSNRYM